MKKDINIGDVVEVLSYSELLGSADSVDGDDCLVFGKEYFTPSMKKLCNCTGKVVGFEDVEDSEDDYLMYIGFENEVGISPFMFTKEMVMSCKNSKEKYKPIVAFDFDGVIHSYVSGWKGLENCPDPVVEGIGDVIENLRKDGFKVVVHSSRCKLRPGIMAVKNYLEKNNIVVDDVVSEKPSSVVNIDDRAICFDGTTDKLVEQIKKFKPWMKK